MADLLYFPAERRINDVHIDIDAGNKPTSIKKFHHKSGDIHLWIMSDSIEAGAAALNGYLAGETKAEEKYL